VPGSGSWRDVVRAAALVFAAFGVIGFMAALGDPVAIGETVRHHRGRRRVGLWVLGWLLDRREHGPMWSARTVRRGSMPDWSRRSFLVRAGAVGVVRSPSGRWPVAADRGAQLDPDRRGPAIPPATSRSRRLHPKPISAPTVPGLTPIVQPNDGFYRIDTALLVPTVETDTWTLRIHGLVDRETTLTWASSSRCRCSSST
jgi:hypothetical protein